MSLLPGRTTRGKLHRGQDSQCLVCNQHCCRYCTLLALSHRALLLLQLLRIGRESGQATGWLSYRCIIHAIVSAVVPDAAYCSPSLARERPTCRRAVTSDSCTVAPEVVPAVPA